MPPDDYYAPGANPAAQQMNNAANNTGMPVGFSA